MVILTILFVKAGNFGIECTIINPWAIEGLTAITVLEWAAEEEVEALGF